jgi:hypothetical protein
MPHPKCKAYRVGDQMICSECNVTWDTNDQDPPSCHTEPESICCSDCGARLFAWEINFFIEHLTDRPVRCSPCYRKFKP